MLYVLCFFRQSLGATVKYGLVNGQPGVIKSNQRITDAVRITTLTKGGVSFQEAEDMPIYKKQIIIAELNKINKEMNKQ